MFQKELLKGVMTLTKHAFGSKHEKVIINYFKLEKINLTLGKQNFDLVLFLVHSSKSLLIYGINSISQRKSLILGKVFQHKIDLCGTYRFGINPFIIVHSEYYDEDINDNKERNVIKGSEYCFCIFSPTENRNILNLSRKTPILSYTSNNDFLIIRFRDVLEIMCIETKRFIFSISIESNSIYDLSNTYLALYSNEDKNENLTSKDPNQSVYVSYLQDTITWGKQIKDIYNLSLELGNKEGDKNSKLNKYCKIKIFCLEEIKKYILETNSCSCNDDKDERKREEKNTFIIENHSLNIIVPFFNEIHQLNFINNKRQLLIGINGQIFYVYDLFPTSYLKYNESENYSEMEVNSYSSFRDINFKGLKFNPRYHILNSANFKMSYTLFRGYTASSLYNTDSCLGFTSITSSNGTVHLYYLPNNSSEDYIENTSQSNIKENKNLNPKEGYYIDKVSYASYIANNDNIILFSYLTYKVQPANTNYNSNDDSYYNCVILTNVVLNGENFTIDYYYFDSSKQKLVKISSDNINYQDFSESNKTNYFLTNKNEFINKDESQKNKENSKNFNISTNPYIIDKVTNKIAVYDYNRAIEVKTFAKNLSDIHHNPIFKVTLYKRKTLSKISNNIGNIPNNLSQSQIQGNMSFRKRSIESKVPSIITSPKIDTLIRITTIQFYVINNSFNIVDSSDSNLYNDLLLNKKYYSTLSFNSVNDKSEYSLVVKSNSNNYNFNEYAEVSTIKCPKIIVNINDSRIDKTSSDKNSFYDNKEVILKNNIKQAMESQLKKQNNDIVIFSSEIDLQEDYLSQNFKK